MGDWSQKAIEKIFVEVDYYDGDHRRALERYASADQIQDVVKHGIEVAVPDFLTYLLFHRACSLPLHYAGYRQTRERIADAYGKLGDLVELEHGSLYLPAGALGLPVDLTEHIGESIGLSVINRIHGVTEADWKPVSTTTDNKTLDYELASDGAHRIQVETKGSVAENPNAKSPAISNHKRSIAEKKGDLRRADPEIQSYGTIVVIPFGPRPLKCWLLDPPPTDLERSPRDFRILARLEFLRWILWLISPRATLVGALATRVRAVAALRDPYELSGVPLAHPDGRPIEVDSRFRGSQAYAGFFASRSRVADGPAGGIVTPLEGHGTLLFIGVREDLLHLVTGQLFEAITNYAAEWGSVEKVVNCTVSSAEFDRFDIPENRLVGFRRSSGYVSFRMRGMLRYSVEGLVFGEIGGW